MRFARIVACAALLLTISSPASAHWRASGWRAWRGYGHHSCRSNGLCLSSGHRRRDPLDFIGSSAWRARVSGQDLDDFESRDAHGRFRRSSAAREAFEYNSPCPSTGRSYGACPGYVVDHIIALKRGGADDPSNMQWQTVEDAKAKDKVE